MSEATLTKNEIEACKPGTRLNLQVFFKGLEAWDKSKQNWTVTVDVPGVGLITVPARYLGAQKEFLDNTATE